MIELLVPATTAQLDRVEGNKQTFDLRIRPGLMLQTIRALQDAGVEPDIWKIEGLDRREDCERVVEMARRDGRGHVSCIVLGRGADETKVVSWLETAASVPGFIGFAVGRTTFWDAVADYEARRVTRQDAVAVWPTATANGRPFLSGRTQYPRVSRDGHTACLTGIGHLLPHGAPGMAGARSPLPRHPGRASPHAVRRRSRHAASA